MSITKVGYLPSGFLNSAASASPTGSIDAETQTPIATGLNVGAFQEFSDGEALEYTNPKIGQLLSIVQVTAGTGMTPGTYALTIGAPPTGGTQAVGTVTVTATAVTSFSITNPGSGYIAPPAVSAATGGTPVVLAATIGNQLFSGTYEWGQLDPAVTGVVPVGTPLFWLAGSGAKMVTTVATANTNSPDFAGFSIDPNFGAALPYAFFQRNGKGSLLFTTTPAPAAYGDVVNFVPGTASFTSLATATLTTTQSTVGFSLAVGILGTTCLCRVTWPIARY
jgi:hypothetical protein